jgi:hypothetical protein
VPGQAGVAEDLAVEAPPETGRPAPDQPPPGLPRRAWRRRRVRARVVDAAAALLVVAVLLAPDRYWEVSPAVFARLPVEALAGVGLVLALPRRWARLTVAAGAAAGAVLGVGRAADMGFNEVLRRPFDPVLDWPFVTDAAEFLRGEIGAAGTAAVAVGAVLAALALVALTTLAALRLAGLAGRHPRPAARALAAASAVWLASALLGLDTAAGQPFAARSTIDGAVAREQQVVAALRDRAAFAEQARTDAFRDTAPADLLVGLRGKTVILAFVESYGRSAVQDPALAPRVDAALDAGTVGLRAAGFAARSGWLTSPTFGAGSWFAHSTLLSGLWVDNQQRYRTVVASDRFTFTGAFAKAGWRTVGWEPGVTRAWPEGAFYHYDQIVDSRAMGYRGPPFSWAPVPDQYTLAALQRRELAPGHAPVMAEVTLVSSHAPWAPLPAAVPWETVGDGDVFDPMPAAGDQPGAVWADPASVKAAYVQSVTYSLQTLISFVERYGDDDTVLVLLGDHQPAQVVTGPDASRDVPVTVVAHDPAVLDRISGWGWSDGLRPAPSAPVWRMDAFRDRFLAAYGPAAPTASSATSRPNDHTSAASARPTAGAATATGRTPATATARTTP